MAELSFYIPTRLAVVELPDTTISVQEIVDQFRDFEDNPETMVHRRMLHAEGKLALPDGSNMIVAAAMLDGWRVQFIDRPQAQYLSMDGDVGEVTTPDHSSLNIAGDIEMVMQVQIDDLSNGPGLIDKMASNDGYRVMVFSNGAIQLAWGDGASQHFWSSFASAVTSATNWIRVTLDVDNGASGHTMTFETSTDPINLLPANVSWTLDRTRIFGGVTSISANTGNPLRHGVRDGIFNLDGSLYRVWVYDGIGGTLVAGFNANDFAVGDTHTDTAVDTTGKTWTINGTASVIVDTVITECQVSAGNIIAYTGELGVGPQIPVAPSAFVFASFAAATTGAIVTSSAFDANVNLMRQILDNRLETDPVAGVMTLYDDDGITPIRTWNIWEDILQVQAYRSRGMERRDAGV